MKIIIHQVKSRAADFETIYKTLEAALQDAKDNELHLFPELYLTGYPLQDICLQNSFIKAYEYHLNKIEKLFKNSQSNGACFLVGGLKYFFSEQNNEVPRHIENVVFKLEAGRSIEKLYTKMLLPNYDIFDEKKYFTAGNEAKILEWNKKKIGLLICEDMWHSNVHNIDPVKNLEQLGEKLDLVVNLSASPYNLYKDEKRYMRAKEISHLLKAPFVYINQVSGEDEILFDGKSFMANGSQISCELKSFKQDLLGFDLPDYSAHASQSKNDNESNTWEDLFSADIDFSNKGLPKLKTLTDKHCQEIIDALCFGLQEYATKNGFKKFTIALSGGIDSALVLALTKIALKPDQSLEAIYMPSEFSRDISYESSKNMCEKAGIDLKVLPIKKAHHLMRELFDSELQTPLEGLADENIQSRLRGLLLFARSNQTNSMVINTSNKSELSVGYSTLYGDSVGAISLLGDIYKSEVYELSRYINKNYQNLIPEDIITREPSAELRADQVDTDSLPAYEILDTILEGILSYRMSKTRLLELGFSEADINRTFNLYRKSEFKRAQFCPIIKIKSKSYGFGYRVPISKNSDYYLL